jgi:putative exporter of polyketide antibiotics
MRMSNTIQTIATGALGTISVAATNVVNEVALKGNEVAEAVKVSTLPSPEEISGLGQLIIQAIIAIITVWRLIKKPKN